MAIEGLCAVCTAPATKHCPVCRSIRFCGPEHYKLIWSSHKLICKSNTLVYEGRPPSQLELEACCQLPDVPWALAPMNTQNLNESELKLAGPDLYRQCLLMLSPIEGEQLKIRMLSSLARSNPRPPHAAFAYTSQILTSPESPPPSEITTQEGMTEYLNRETERLGAALAALSPDARNAIQLQVLIVATLVEKDAAEELVTLAVQRLDEVGNAQGIRGMGGRARSLTFTFTKQLWTSHKLLCKPDAPLVFAGRRLEDAELLAALAHPENLVLLREQMARSTPLELEDFAACIHFVNVAPSPSLPHPAYAYTSLILCEADDTVTSLQYRRHQEAKSEGLETRDPEITFRMITRFLDPDTRNAFELQALLWSSHKLLCKPNAPLIFRGRRLEDSELQVSVDVDAMRRDGLSDDNEAKLTLADLRDQIDLMNPLEREEISLMILLANAVSPSPPHPAHAYTSLFFSDVAVSSRPRHSLTHRQNREAIADGATIHRPDDMLASTLAGFDSATRNACELQTLVLCTLLEKGVEEELVELAMQRLGEIVEGDERIVGRAIKAVEAVKKIRARG
ncbi:hypothetical protein RQP46_008977 [Phenoliferia psychrophenolica]